MGSASIRFLTVEIKHRCWSGRAAGQSAVFLAAMKLTAKRLTFGEFSLASPPA
jgi:hypothetical protein